MSEWLPHRRRHDRHEHRHSFTGGLVHPDKAMATESTGTKLYFIEQSIVRIAKRCRLYIAPFAKANFIPSTSVPGTKHV